MAYDKKHVAVLDPQAGYNKLATKYIEYHSHLDGFEKGQFVRFVPRDLNDKDILDLGAGDGRLYKYFVDKDYKSYTACDIAPDLLQQHPGDKVHKIVCDLEQTLPFSDASIDIVLSFFVLEHIQNINELFQEVYRIMRSGGMRIIGHFIQRRAFVHQIRHEAFKIAIYNHAIKDLERIAIESFFTIHTLPIYEKDILLGHILICSK